MHIYSSRSNDKNVETIIAHVVFTNWTKLNFLQRNCVQLSTRVKKKSRKLNQWTTTSSSTSRAKFPMTRMKIIRSHAINRFLKHHKPLPSSQKFLRRWRTNLALPIWWRIMAAILKKVIFIPSFYKTSPATKTWQETFDQRFLKNVEFGVIFVIFTFFVCRWGTWRNSHQKIKIGNSTSQRSSRSPRISGKTRNHWAECHCKKSATQGQ